MFLKVNRDEIIEGLQKSANIIPGQDRSRIPSHHLAPVREWKRQRDEHGFEHGIHGILSGCH